MHSLRDPFTCEIDLSSPLVSVIVAVRNGERFLSSALTSILNQDYRRLEIIVVDGQSEDSTAEIAQSFEHVRRSVV